MTNEAELGADTLRRIWQKGVPDAGAPSLVASTGKVVLGTGKGGFTDLSGSLVVLDAHSGEIVRQRQDYWQVLSLALSGDGRWLAVLRTVQAECVDYDPTNEHCDQLEVWVVSTTDNRKRRIFTGPQLSEGYGLDWRPAHPRPRAG